MDIIVSLQLFKKAGKGFLIIAAVVLSIDLDHESRYRRIANVGKSHFLI